MRPERVDGRSRLVAGRFRRRCEGTRIGRVQQPVGVLRLVPAVFRARRNAERDADTGTGIGLGIGSERGPGATLVAGVAAG